jgi:hypothetical protein
VLANEARVERMRLRGLDWIEGGAASRFIRSMVGVVPQVEAKTSITHVGSTASVSTQLWAPAWVVQLAGAVHWPTPKRRVLIEAALATADGQAAAMAALRLDPVRR